jgi:RNA polymerase sigma-70 factor (ECF subfamily)
VTSEQIDLGATLAQARRGDEDSFAAIVASHNRALFRHCYRMLGSGPDAEDAVQDTLVRAWRRLDTFDAAGTFGGWLYRIATNVCFDVLRSRRVRLGPFGEGPPSDPRTMLAAPDTELVWVEPIGDAQAGSTLDPQDEVVRREEINLAFIAALQRLAPRQRACLLLHDVLGFSQAEVAEALDISASGVNSLLFRARESARPRDDAPLLAASDPRVGELLERYVNAWHLADIAAFVELVSDDIRLSMPPLSEWFDGRTAVAAFIENAVFAATKPNGVPMLLGWCNGQPALATYEPAPDGSVTVGGVQILEIRERDGKLLITDIVSYRDADLAIRSGFPSNIS